MTNNSAHIVSENEFNALLNQAFTGLDFDEPANAKMLDAVSARILHRSGFVSNGTSFKYKHIISALTIMLGISLACFFMSGKNKGPNKMQNMLLTAGSKDSIAERPALMEEPVVFAASTYTKKPTVSEQKVLVNPSQNKQPPPSIAEGADKANNTPDVAENNKLQKIEEEYIFPVLTEKEIKANEKEKRRIIKIVSRINRDKRDDIARVPASPDGAFGGFYMGSGEVTNNEYRTFLFDLLINGRKEEFLIAKPAQGLWKNVEGMTIFDTLAKVYFSDKMYNFYPVVNITAEGAEMYCRWLQDGVDALRSKDDKIPAIEVRLPYEKEWLYAARSGRENPPYPWPLESVQNHVNYFMANFCIQKRKEELRTPLLFPHSKRERDLSNYTVAGMMLNRPGIAAIEVWSFNPNTFGLYGVSGNASEMVYIDGTKKIKTKGGNWASDYKHLRLDSEDEFEGKIGPSPRIGFRVCAFMK